jgi:hypothetical protein
MALPGLSAGNVLHTAHLMPHTPHFHLAVIAGHGPPRPVSRQRAGARAVYAAAGPD